MKKIILFAIFAVMFVINNAISATTYPSCPPDHVPSDEYLFVVGPGDDCPTLDGYVDAPDMEVIKDSEDCETELGTGWVEMPEIKAVVCDKAKGECDAKGISGFSCTVP